MGYYTTFSLEIISGDDYKTDYLERIGEISDYGNIENNSIKWYSHEEDMKILSKEYPEVVFALKGEGGESEDIWIKYFKNGKKQTAKAKITFEEYDETKLV